MKRYKNSIVVLTLSLILSACASFSGINTQGNKLEANNLGAKQAQTDWPQADWWLAMHDETLNSLIEQALKGSPSLQEADTRLQKAWAVAGVADSFRYPQVSAGLESTRERFSERGTTPPPYAGTTQTINDLSVKGSWELDFFGRNREGLNAALGELRASEAEHQAARIMLTTDVARNYFALARLQVQRDLAEQQNRQRTELLQLEDSRVKAGIDAPGDLEPLKSGVAENRRDALALDEQIALTRHALSALLGQGPNATANVNAVLPPATVTALPQELPIELLGHRADIVAARWRVESNLHGMESAKAMFYPNINLRSFAGFSSIGTDKFLDGGSRQPGLGIAITLPIFDADRLRNQYRGITAQTDGAIASYNKTLVNAFRDVADQLSSLQSIEQQLKRQENALGSAQQSYEFARQRYQAGITGSLPVLNAEASLLNQRRAMTDLQARWTDGRIKLIHALGGGFKEISEKEQLNNEQQHLNDGAHHG